MSLPSPQTQAQKALAQKARARLTAVEAMLPNWIPQEVPAPPEGFGEAAVAIVLRAAESVDLLLIRRSRWKKDPWSGHMALPGGRRETADSTLLHTAVRETNEETAVNLENARVLGRLALVSTLSALLPKLTVTPLVLGIDGPAEAVVNSHEIAAVHWAPLDELLDPASREFTTIPMPDGPRDFPCFRLDGQIVWGLTHRILDQLANYLGAP